MNPIVQEELVSFLGIVQGHNICTVLHGARCFLMHAAVKECVGDFKELAIEGHLGNQRKIAAGVVAEQSCLAKGVGAAQTVVKVAQTDIAASSLPPVARTLIHQMQVFVEVADNLASVINKFSSGVSDKNGGVVVEDIHGALQKIGADKIVGRRPAKIVADGKFEAASVIARCAKVLSVAIIFYARISRGIRAAYLLAAVGGGIVGEDQLKVRIGLIKMGFDGFSQIHLAVVDRHGHADIGLPGSVGW